MKRLTTWTSMDGKAKLIVADGTLSDKLIEQIAIQRLAEYEDAEEQGLLVRLPCRLGIPIYCLWGDDIFTETIEMICVSDKGFCLETENMGFDESDIGKVVFLTREAAEKAFKDA